MTWLDNIRAEAAATAPERSLEALSEHNRTRLATLVSWCSVSRAAQVVGVCSATLERAMQGVPVQDRTHAAIESGLNRAYDALEPDIVRLARVLT